MADARSLFEAARELACEMLSAPAISKSHGELFRKAVPLGDVNFDSDQAEAIASIINVSLSRLPRGEASIICETYPENGQRFIALHSASEMVLRGALINPLRNAVDASRDHFLKDENWRTIGVIEGKECLRRDFTLDEGHLFSKLLKAHGLTETDVELDSDNSSASVLISRDELQELQRREPGADTARNRIFNMSPLPGQHTP